jgi:hypothetical protein
MPAIRSKTLGNKNTVTKKIIKEPICTECGLIGEKNFYNSNSQTHHNFEKLPVCKHCADRQYQKYYSKYEDSKLAIFYTCRKFDIYYDTSVYDGALNHSAAQGWSVFPSYMKQLNSFGKANSYGSCFDESSEFLDRVFIKSAESEVKKKVKEDEVKNPNEQNKSDVIRMLGYDPFEAEDEDEKPMMYNKIIDFLDESTLDDGFKVLAIVEIVKGFNQIEKINRAINKLDGESASIKASEIKSLMTTKSSMMNAILAMAKDNGISVNHSTNKSKGAGTLSGIIKTLQEKDIRESDVNLFDIETLGGIKQVADISNQSILDQLSFDENSYTEMIKDQIVLIEEYRSKFEKTEEELRLLKIKMSKLTDK